MRICEPKPIFVVTMNTDLTFDTKLLFTIAVDETQHGKNTISAFRAVCQMADKLGEMTSS